VFGTITNIQWIAAAALPLLACSDTQGRARRANEALFILATCLSGPFAVLALPLFGWRWWQRRDRYSLVLFTVVCATSLIQLGVIATSERPQVDAPPPVIMLLTGLYRVFATLAVGTLEPDVLGLAVALGILVAVVAAAGSPEQRQVGVCLAVFSVLLLAAASWFPLDSSGYRLPRWGDRYFYGAKLAVVWLLVCAALDRTRFTAAFAVAALVCLNPFKRGDIPQFRKPAVMDFRWKEQAALIQPGQAARIAINPPPWFVVLPSPR
jgi:hypothetical protein